MQFVALDDIAHQISLHGTSSCRKLFGGKALNLGILQDNGFDVPLGFVIPTPVFENILSDAFHRMIDLSPQESIELIEFDEEFNKELDRCMTLCNAQKWAIRSSSTDEDSSTHSFAGLQQSVIGVSSRSAILEAIRTVWQSFYARERLLYPIDASLSAPIPAMAVIIQACIDPDEAGVVFTKHPLEGNATLLVNVSRGQGANVVDGKAGETLCVPRNDGVSEIPSECLDASDIEQLRQTACRIEACFNRPQDIEFAFKKHRLYILQARDIAATQENTPNVLYSNVNVGEALYGVCTPMTWSVGMMIANQGFKAIFAMLGLKIPPEYEFITTFNGHIYLNISQFLSVASQVPFVDPAVFGKVAGIQSLREFACALVPMSHVHFIKNLPHSLVELFKMEKRLKKLPQKAEPFEQKRDKLLSLDLTNADNPEILRAFDELNELFFDSSIDMLGAGGAFLTSYVLCSNFIGHFTETESRELEQSLLSGLLDVKSAAPGIELLDLAQVIRQYPALTAAFIDEDSFQDLEAFTKTIQPLDGYQEFHTKYSQFISHHGARAHQEAELANPRWKEDPRFLFRVIRTHLKSGTQKDSKSIVNSASEHRQQSTNQFKSMLSATMRPMFRRLLSMTQKYARLRETWRAYVVDVLGIFRQYLLQTASVWTEQKVLRTPDDIFFLTFDEVMDGLKTNDLAKLNLRVAFRRARHEAYLSSCSLPDTFITHPNQCLETGTAPASRVLTGLAASPGCVRAPVRIIHSLDEAASLEYGEILVTTSTDVAWTPLFLVASAILTERGGPLSHAFVVAREYGIPAIVSVPNLLDSLKTGDIVRISGQKGMIMIEES